MRQDGADTDDAVYVVTERVEPLVEWHADAAAKSDAAILSSAVCWGLYGVAKAVSFVNNDCKLVHGNVCRDSVFVSRVRPALLQ